MPDGNEFSGDFSGIFADSLPDTVYPALRSPVESGSGSVFYDTTPSSGDAAAPSKSNGYSFSDFTGALQSVGSAAGTLTGAAINLRGQADAFGIAKSQQDLQRYLAGIQLDATKIQAQGALGVANANTAAQIATANANAARQQGVARFFQTVSSSGFMNMVMLALTGIGVYFAYEQIHRRK